MATEQTLDWRNLPPLPESEQPQLPADWTPSQTFLRIHDRCDRAAYLHLRHRGGAGAHELHRGALFHTTIERLTRFLIAEEEPQATPEHGREFLAETMRDHPELQVCASERDALRYMVDHWCRGTYFDRPIIGLETTLTLEIGDWRVLIRPDLIIDAGGGLCEIWDYKTAWPPSAEDFRKQAFDAEGNPRWAGNFQLNMASVVATFGVADDGMRLGNFERWRLVLGFPRELRPEGIVTREVEVYPPQVTGFREDLELQLQRLSEVNLSQRLWQPTPGSHCAECPVPDECPLPRVLRPDSQLAGAETLEELEEAAAAANFMSKRAGDLKARVRKGAERLQETDPTVLDLGDGERGVRIGRDLAFVFRSTERESVKDKAALREAVERAVQYGEPVDFTQHYRYSDNVEFVKRKVAPRRQNGESDG